MAAADEQPAWVPLSQPQIAAYDEHGFTIVLPPLNAYPRYQW